MCGSMVDIRSAAVEIRPGKKERKKKEERINDRMKIKWSVLFHRATITSPLKSDLRSVDSSIVSSRNMDNVVQCQQFSNVELLYYSVTCWAAKFQALL